MTRALRIAGAAIGLLLVQGCVTTYQLKPGDELATVRNVGHGQPQMCVDGKVYWPPEAKDIPGAFSVPAGNRLTMGAHLSSQGYQVVHYCRPFLSFQPKAGESYVMNSALSGPGMCGVELVREDNATPSGVTLEPSVGRAACSAPR
jgi:hypothetical protein